MSVIEAFAKADISRKVGRKYYQEYLENPQNGIPKPCLATFSKEDVKEVIDIIVNGGVSWAGAAKQMGMSIHVVKQYHRAHMECFENKIFDDQSPSYQMRIEEIKEIYGDQTD